MLVSLFPQPPHHHSKVSWKKVAGIEITHGLSTMDFHSPRLTWLQSLLSIWLVSCRAQHCIPDLAPFPGIINKLPGDKLITLDCFHHGRGSVLFSLWIWGCLPACNTSAQTTICGLLRGITWHHGILHRIVSDQGSHFTVKEIWQWAHAYEIHWSSHVPHYPKALVW